MTTGTASTIYRRGTPGSLPGSDRLYLNQELAKLEQTTTALSAAIDLAGSAGAAGPPGPAGPTGPAGPGFNTYTNVLGFMTTTEIADAATNRLGTIDITTKVQAAIDSLSAGTVFIPAGVYLFGNVTLKPGVAILGAGPGSTVVKANAANAHIFDYVAAASALYFNISGITFDNNGLSGVRAISIDGTDSTKRCVFVTITNCLFSGMRYAVYRAYCANSFLANLHATGGTDGFLNDTCADTDFVNCRSQLASGNGFVISKTSGPTDHSDEGTRMTNCSTNGTVVGLLVSGANWGALSSCSFTTCSGGAAFFESCGNWNWNGGDAASAGGAAGVVIDSGCSKITLNGLNIALNTFGVSFAGDQHSVTNSKFVGNTNADAVVNANHIIIMGNIADSFGSSTFSFAEAGGDKNIITNNIVRQPVSIAGVHSIANNNVAL